MNTISFPRYSFVQAQPDPMREDVPTSCYPDPRSCLPISTPVNLAFQITAGDSISPPFFTAYTGSFYAYAVPVNESIRWTTQTSGTFETHTPFIKSSFRLYNVGYVTAMFDDATYNDSFQAYPIAVGECFKLQFVYDEIYSSTQTIHQRYYLGCSTNFIRVPVNECYTTLLQYRNPKDTFDFSYYNPNESTGHEGENNLGYYYNKVELPIYLKNPVMNDDTKVYTRSDGTIIKLYERKEEQYLLETDQMPYTWLRALDVALSHDTVLLHNSNLSSFDPINTAIFFQKKENFEIEYQKGPFSAFGKGNCKLLNAQPVHLYNNNC
ncbi:MAG: hypothetical protein JSS76_19620 [Bacteroidetes bacterium]|nr:hypothetical protein [Bacteroidota bacterium]